MADPLTPEDAALREALKAALAIELLDVFMCDHQAAHDCAADVADAFLPIVQAEAERLARALASPDSLRLDPHPDRECAECPRPVPHVHCAYTYSDGVGCGCVEDDHPSSILHAFKRPAPDPEDPVNADSLADALNTHHQPDTTCPICRYAQDHLIAAMNSRETLMTTELSRYELLHDDPESVDTTTVNDTTTVTFEGTAYEVKRDHTGLPVLSVIGELFDLAPDGEEDEEDDR